MGGIQQCVKDVLRIAYETEDFSQAKARIEQLFVEAKAGHRGTPASCQKAVVHPQSALMPLAMIL
jgi:hypothetical protein